MPCEGIHADVTKIDNGDFGDDEFHEVLAESYAKYKRFNDKDDSKIIKNLR